MTQQAQHTPGPWQYDDNECPWVFDQSGNTVAKIFSSKPDGVFLGDETKANARLIAAAPELLEALQAMVAMYAPRGGRIVFDDPSDAARAAIAKAKGGAA